MKSVTIGITDAGSVVHFSIPRGVKSGEVVIVTSDDVEVQISKGTISPQPKSKLKREPQVDLDAVLKRLQKLGPRKRATAVNSIKAMFQFTEPIDDAAASKILDEFQRAGWITVDGADRLEFKE